MQLPDNFPANETRCAGDQDFHGKRWSDGVVECWAGTIQTPIIPLLQSSITPLLHRSISTSFRRSL